MLRRSAPWRCGDVEIRCFGTGLELHPVNRVFLERFRPIGHTRWMQWLRPAQNASGRMALVSAGGRRQTEFSSDFAIIKFRLDESCAASATHASRGASVP
jgi:hypothetical protein